MAATALPVVTMSEASPAVPIPQWAADNVNGNTFQNSPSTFLEMTNTAGTAATVTVAYLAQVDGQTVPPRSYTLPAPITTTLAAAPSAGATTVSSTATVPVGSVIFVDTGSLAEQRTTTAVSGAGPYTLTFASPLAASHSSGVPLTVSGGRKAGLFPVGLFGQNPVITSSAATVTLAAYQLS